MGLRKNRARPLLRYLLSGTGPDRTYHQRIRQNYLHSATDSEISCWTLIPFGLRHFAQGLVLNLRRWICGLDQRPSEPFWGAVHRSVHLTQCGVFRPPSSLDGILPLSRGPDSLRGEIYHGESGNRNIPTTKRGGFLPGCAEHPAKRKFLFGRLGCANSASAEVPLRRIDSTANRPFLCIWKGHRLHCQD